MPPLQLPSLLQNENHRNDAGGITDGVVAPAEGDGGRYNDNDDVVNAACCHWVVEG